MYDLSWLELVRERFCSWYSTTKGSFLSVLHTLDRERPTWVNAVRAILLSVVVFGASITVQHLAHWLRGVPFPEYRPLPRPRFLGRAFGSVKKESYPRSTYAELWTRAQRCWVTPLLCLVVSILYFGIVVHDVRLDELINPTRAAFACMIFAALFLWAFFITDYVVSVHPRWKAAFVATYTLPMHLLGIITPFRQLVLYIASAMHYKLTTIDAVLAIFVAGLVLFVLCYALYCRRRHLRPFALAVSVPLAIEEIDGGSYSSLYVFMDVNMRWPHYCWYGLTKAYANMPNMPNMPPKVVYHYASLNCRLTPTRIEPPISIVLPAKLGALPYLSAIVDACTVPVIFQWWITSYIARSLHMGATAPCPILERSAQVRVFFEGISSPCYPPVRIWPRVHPGVSVYHFPSHRDIMPHFEPGTVRVVRFSATTYFITDTLARATLVTMEPWGQAVYYFNLEKAVRLAEDHYRVPAVAIPSSSPAFYPPDYPGHPYSFSGLNLIWNRSRGPLGFEDLYGDGGGASLPPYYQSVSYTFRNRAEADVLFRTSCEASSRAIWRHFAYGGTTPVKRVFPPAAQPVVP